MDGRQRSSEQQFRGSPRGVGYVIVLGAAVLLVGLVFSAVMTWIMT